MAAIGRGLVRSCHDLSEGGLAVALAEMALAGGLGARASLGDVPRDDDDANDAALLFSESPTRFLLEVRPEHADTFRRDLHPDLRAKRRQRRRALRADALVRRTGAAGFAGAG